MAEFLTGNPRCPICAGHHPVKAPCFLSTNWIPLEKTPMADETVEALRRRAEAAEAQVERLKGVLQRLGSAEAFDMARALDADNAELIMRMDFARSALEAKP